MREGDTYASANKAEGGDERARFGLRSLRLRGLPGQVLLFVFGALLITSLTVTSASLYTVSSFLRQKVDREFPILLSEAADVIDEWYDQRLAEVAVLSQSDILNQNLRHLAAHATDGTSLDPERDARARNEVGRYLGHVLQGFDHYTALIALDAAGEVLVSTDEGVALDADLRAELTLIDEPRTSQLLPLIAGGVQIVSAPVEGEDGIGGSIHALLDVSRLDNLLRNEKSDTIETFLIDAQGRVVAGLAGARDTEPHALKLPESDSAVTAYTTTSGLEVVAATLRIPRFEWTLVIEQPHAVAFVPVSSALRNIVIFDLMAMLGIGFVAFRIAVSISQPIEALADAARRLSRGEKNVRIEQKTTSAEVALLIDTFNQMSYRLERDADEIESVHAEVEYANHQLRNQNEELQQMNEILEQLSITDGLTKLHNHRFFQDQLVRECKRTDRIGDPLSLILIDIDHFKRWNDRLGHAVGDEILAKMADVLREVIRETDLLARYGGEEFALLASDTDLDGAIALAEKARAAVAAKTFLIELPSQAREPVTVSVGVALYRGDRKKLFTDADTALYDAKNAGRDCVMFADPDNDECAEDA